LASFGNFLQLREKAFAPREWRLIIKVGRGFSISAQNGNSGGSRLLLGILVDNGTDGLPELALDALLLDIIPGSLLQSRISNSLGSRDNVSREIGGDAA
jgi:hypothetical protein